MKLGSATDVMLKPRRTPSTQKSNERSEKTKIV